MNQPSERVATACPACSPGEPTPHELLREGGLATVRCTDCGHTHKTDLPEAERVERQVVVSQDGDSFTARASFPADERLATGEEFLLDAEEAIVEARITDLQVGAEERVGAAPVADVETVWTRAVGNVTVDLTLHPKEGAGRHTETRSVRLQVPGDEPFVVGETSEHGGESFLVEGIVVREGAGYGRRKYDHDGDAVPAKDCKRVYARDETTSAWSAW
jgi:uncharacterized Zn finger protein